MEHRMVEYRDRLLDAEQRSQGEFDKLLASLSGGALGVSFAFVETFVKDGSPVHPWLLKLSWGLWVLSLLTVLVSHIMSASALREAVRQIDSGVNAGGWRDSVVGGLNWSGCVLFVGGASSAGLFVFANL
jgi:hypothetical protein